MFPLSDPILVFTILMFAILAAPLIAGRLRIPDLVLLLFTGALLGPNGIGMLERSSAVTLFGSVGLLYIMFLAGLEIDLHRFKSTGRSSITFGMLTFLIPQILGTFAGRYLLGFNWQASILLASMFASHTLLAYPIAVRLGISRKEPVVVTVGATIITDTLALLVLAIIADLTRGENPGLSFWATIGLGLIGLILLTWVGIPYLTRWFFTHVTEEGGAQFLFVLVTVCGCSYLSHYAKMEPIIGAFLAGAAFNRLIPEHSALMSRVVFAGNSLFIPFFLISVGMLIDVSALIEHPRSWYVAAVMVVAVIVTKYAAAWLSGALLNYKPEARKVMFGLSVVQAAATLAAVLVGYELNIFDETVLNGAIAMIMITCPLGAWMVERNGRKLADAGSAPIRSAGFEQRLLLPVVNPTSSVKMLDLAFMLRDTALPGAIYPITIVRDESDTESAVAEGEKLLANCLMHAASVTISVEPSVRVDLNVADGIIRATKELRANVVLAGWGGARTASTAIFGTVSRHLVNACPSRLIFCRLVRPLNTTRRLLFLLPPLAERRCDLPSLIRDVKFLSRQIGAEMRVYFAEKETSELRKKVETAQPLRPLVFIASETMADARARVFSDIGSDDMIIVLGERKSSFLWTPTETKLPELMASRFPDNNLLLCYPHSTNCEDNAIPESRDTQSLFFAVQPCELGVSVTFENAVQQMAETTFAKDRALADQVWRLLSASAESYPVGLAADTVLLHAHCDRLENAMLIIGLGHSSWDVEKLPGPQRIIMAMLSPKTDPPEQHLKRLAWLGRMYSDDATVTRIKNALSVEEICRIIQNAE